MAMAAALVAVGGVAAAAPLDSAQQPAHRAAACGGLKPTIKGSKGPDKLKGTASDDVISAGRGADVVKAGAGDDTLCGGPGNDKLLGGPGVDTCDGGPGKDKLKGCEPGEGPSGGAPPGTTVPPVNESPVADDESFDGPNGAVGNTALVVNAPGDGPPALSTPKKSITGDILSGDTDPNGDSLIVQAVTNQPTNDGGRVTIEADGDFIFTPAAATSCTDHSDFFDYTVSDQNAVGPGPTPGTDTGRVTIEIAGCVWYVNNSAVGNSGASDAPFDTLAQGEAASSVNDSVFVFDGDNTSTGYGGDGYAMNAGERLIGEEAGLFVDPDGGGPLGSVSLQPANPGASPTLTASNADVIDLDDGNEVRGVTVDPQGTGGGIAGGAGDSGGTIDDVKVADTGTTGTQPGIELNGTTGTFNLSSLTVSTSDATGMLLNNAGTVAVTGAGNSINSVSATALNVTSTTIGAAGLTFQSISAGNNTPSADPTNGIVLSATGSNGGLTVTGSGNSSLGGDNSGGTIQNTTGHGIALANTTSPAFTNMNLQSTGGSGINGTQVSNFSFANGTINNSGDALGESNIAFNGNGTLAGNNINGTLSVTSSVLTNAFEHGVHVQNNDGTISNATITGNTITSTTSTATSFGSGIRLVGTGTASTVGSLMKATISGNTVRNFPSGAGIQVFYGNASATGPLATAGIPSDASNVVSITNNTVRGFDATNRFGTSAIIVLVSGGNSGQRGRGNFNVSSNGTVAQPIGDSAGTAISVSNFGYATMTATVNNNVIVGHNTAGTQGIGGGNGFVVNSAETPDLTLTAMNNTISQTDGNGILLVGRGTSGLAKFSIKSNTVAAPLSGVRPGIRVDAGDAGSVDDAVCLDISGNTSAGSGGSQGIGLRKQGTTSTINDFGVEGMAATATPGVEAFVDSQNPSGGGTLLISATTGFSSCSTAP